jgi:hypothetical protein
VSGAPDKRPATVYSRPVRFGPWHPIESAASEAPDGPGVLQTRADDLLDYPRGKSAMVLYAHSASEGSLRGYLSGTGTTDLGKAARAGGRWIRFAETSEPEADFERLLDHFVERFGAPPLANGSLTVEPGR